MARSLVPPDIVHRARDALERSPRLAAAGRQVLFWASFLSLPFALLSWAAPFVSVETFGNDYSLWSMWPQLDLMFSIEQGTFALYMPGFAGGHSTAAMTLGQVYHPISWVSSLVPGYWDGQALEINTLFRFLSLGATHAALYRLCRRLSLSRVGAFLATTPAVYNLRMLDSFRYGASLEGYTAMLLMTVASGHLYLSGATKRATLAFAASTYLLIVSGNPQWAYFGALAAGTVAALFPWIASALSDDVPPPSRQDLRAYFTRLAIAGSSALLFAMPYCLTFYFEVLKTNTTRAESSYEWTLMYGDTARGAFANFFYPLRADVHGAFAGSALFVVVAFLPLVLLARIRPPKVLWLLWSLMLVAFVFSMGSRGVGDGAVHRFMVEYVPGFSTMRVPGRITLWIPTLMWPVAAWLLRPASARALNTLGIAGVVVFLAKWFWGARGYPRTGAARPAEIAGGAFDPALDKILLFAVGGTLLALAIASAYRSASRFLLPLAAALVLFTTKICLENGTWKMLKLPTKTHAKLVEIHKMNPLARDTAGEGIEVREVTEYTSRKLSTKRPLGSILHDARRLEDWDVMWSAFEASQRKAPLFIEGDPAPARPEFAGDRDLVKLVYNTPNRFEFDVVAGRDGYFLLGMPYLEGFRAKVDGADAPVVRANGLFPAVFVPHGEHRVELYYVSVPFLVGVGFAFLTAWAWIAWLSGVMKRPKKWRAAAAACFALSAIGLVFGGRAWLYQGPSFETRFFWGQGVPPVAPAAKP